MIKNIFIIAVRSLVKNRFYTILNLTGLAIGLGIFSMIALIIQDQTSYDQFHEKADRIYRIDQTFIWGDAYPTFGSTGPGVAEAVKTYVPGVEQVVRIYSIGEHFVSLPDQPEMIAFEEGNILAADSTFFQIFSIPLIQGNPENALNEPYAVVITESTAMKYFESSEALGKIIKISDGRSTSLFKVTGVCRDVPVQSHFTFNLLTSMTSYPVVMQRSKTWFWSGFVTYALLNHNANIADVEKILFDMPQFYAGQAYENVTSSGKEWHLYLQPLQKIWLYTVDSPNRLGVTGNILYVYILMAVAFIVLTLAIVNYINMATARSINRAKEVGLRKVMGAYKRQLTLQFLTESFVLVVLATLISFYLINVSIPFFNSFTGVTISVQSIFTSIPLMLIMLGIMLLTALLAGGYPAIFMARFQPIQALRKHLKVDKKGRIMRSGLVVFQFTISISLVILSFVVYQQLTFLQTKDLGFDKNNLIIVPQVQRMDSTRRISFQEAMANHPMVSSVGLSTSVPPEIWDGDSFSTDENPDRYVPISFLHVNRTYLSTLSVELKQGRMFGPSFEGDVQNVVLNENAVIALEWANDETVIGKKLIYGNRRFNVIGVIKDFNYRTLDGPIEPLAVFQYGAPIYHSDAHFLSIRLKTSQNQYDDAKQFISFLSTQWEDFAPGLPFNYQFTDDLYFQAFQFEEKLGRIFATFTILAIIIACIGLLGLAAYMVEIRSKEIGIRKVMGASLQQLLVLIGGSFAKLVMIAFLISLPISWLAADKWLQNYEYRIAISWPVFALAGASALVIALLTVSYQSIKTALTNPVDVLKDE